MTQRLLPLAILLVLAVGGIWFATRDSAGRASDRSGDRAVVPVQPTPSSSRTKPSTLAAPPPEIEAAATPAAEARTAAASEYEVELAEATWVEGRVVFPPDTPAEEHVRIVANGLAFEHGPDHAVEVRADGRFKVALSKRTRIGRIELEGTYLYLDEPLKVDTRQKLAPLVLEPRLGGAMKGRVVPPPDDPDGAQELVGRLVKLTASRQVGERSWRSSVRDSVKLEASLEFAFHGLPVDGRFELDLDPLVYDAIELENLFVHAGITDELVLEVLRGATVAGVVRDKAGEPISAQVRTEVESQGSWTPASYRNTITNDGAFRLEGIKPGKTKLTVEAKGYENLEMDLGTLERGETRDALEVVVSRGNAIRGVVLLPDGAPASGALVSTESEDGETSWNSGDGVRAADDGSFTVAGLEPGTYRVNASYSKKERVTVTSELTGKERQRTVKTTLRAAAIGIEAGRGGLVLRVSEGETLAGSVVDERGSGVDDFTVRYGRLIEGDNYTWVPNERNSRFKDAGGVFELDGLEPGTIRIRVKADGFVDSGSVEVEVPGVGLAPIRLTRAAFLSGVVLDPGGDPARDATIQLKGGAASGGMFEGLGYVSMSDNGFSWQGSTDADGRFELENVVPGKIELRASGGGYAPSAPIELTLAPGGRVEDVALQLTLGLRLTGLVVDAGGQGLPHRLVTLDHSRGSGDQTAQTDANGAFAFSGLEPGEYRVSTRPTPAELAAVGLESVDGVDEMLVRQETVQVGPRDGYVVLRPSELAPVRLYGTVTTGGRPASGRLYVYPTGGGQGVSANLDDAGAYTIALPEPRSYNVSVNLDSEANLQRTADLTGRTELRFDIDIPIGAVEGRVFGPDGPVKSTAVQAMRSRDERGEQAWSYANTQTDAQGRYAFEELPAGTWRVSAGGQGGWGGTREQFLAEAAIEDLVVTSGGRVRDADLHLVAAGAIAGRIVSADGSPVENMRVFVRGADGNLVNDFGGRQANGAGKFVVTGLKPGVYLVSAAGAGRATAGETAVDVVANETADVELEAAPATVLHVRTFGVGGAPSHARVKVMRDGVDLADLSDWTLNRNLSVGERRLGPYAPGTYQISASLEDASAPPQTLKLNGEAEVEVELKLAPK